MVQKGNNRTLLIGGIAIAAAALFFTATDAYNAQYLDWQVSNFALSGSGGTITMSVINGSSSTYTVQSITLDILVNGTRIATVSYMGQLIIMPNATSSVNLQLQLDPSGIVATALKVGSQLVQSQDPGAQTVEAKGSANVDGVMVPVDTTLAVVPA